MSAAARLLLSASLLFALSCSKETAARPDSPSGPAQPAPSGHPPPAPADQPQNPTARVTIATPDGAQTFRVEVADERKERSRGLMYRTEMDEDAGMIFVFETMKVQSFWMKNTRLPLDMLFIDDQGVIVGIVENAEPMTTTSRTVGKPSQYVLELHAGTARRRGIQAGQRVRFEGIPGHPVHAPNR